MAHQREPQEAQTEPPTYQVHRLEARLGAKQVGDLVHRYETGESGMTTAELAKKHQLSQGAVLRALHRVGVEMRPKAPRRKSA